MTFQILTSVSQNHALMEEPVKTSKEATNASASQNSLANIVRSVSTLHWSSKLRI